MPRTVAIRETWMSRTLLLCLALPAALHLVTWFRWEVSIPVLAIGAWTLLRAWRAMDDGATMEIPLPRLLTLVLAMAALVAWSGILGNVYQNWDYSKHNAMLGALIHEPWPVVFKSPTRGPGLLTYYVGYYLPAALVGKGLGFEAARWVQGAVAWVMLTASLLLISRRMGRPAGAIVLFMLAFSGADVFGKLAVDGRIPAPGHAYGWWAGFINFPCLSDMLYWGPQHALAGIAGVALFVDGRTTRNAEGLALTFASTLSMSPFITLGLLPFAVIEGLKLAGVARVRAVALAIAIGAPIVGIYLGKIPDPHGWCWNFKGWTPWRQLMFIVFEVFWPAAMVALAGPVTTREERLTVGVSFAWISALSLVTYGLCNDLAMRGPFPAMLIIGVIAWSGWCRLPAGSWRRRVFMAMAIVGLIQPVNEPIKAVLRRPDPLKIRYLPSLPAPEQYITPLQRHPLRALFRSA